MFLLECALECPYVYYAPLLLRAMEGHSIMTLEHVSLEIQENRIINVTKRATYSRTMS